MNVQNNHAYADRDIVGYGDDVWRVFQGNWDIEWNTPIKGLKAQFLYSYYIANNQEERSRKSVPSIHIIEIWTAITRWYIG